ncbi:MAG: CBS domain-containing protein [Halobacteria archaeon]
MKVGEVMHRGAITAMADEPLPPVAERMGERRVGCVVVLKQGKVAGILTERDILRKVVARNKTPARIQVRDVMSAPVTTVTSGTDLDEATALMAEQRIRRLPVVDGGKLVGMLSSSDVVCFLPQMDKILLDMELKAEGSAAKPKKR